MKQFKVNSINDLEMLYSVLRDTYPKNEIEILFNWNTKEYNVIVTDKSYKHDPEVPVDLNIQVVYGDSVTGETCILLRDPKDDIVQVKSIKDLCNEWIEYPEFKMFDTSIRLEKQYGICDLEVWSDRGWNPIKKVIRHKTDKKIYRITTDTGFVDVTEDHSLLLSDKTKISPKNVKSGDLLLTDYPKKFSCCENSKLSNSMSQLLGIHYQKTFNSISDELMNTTDDIVNSFFTGVLYNCTEPFNYYSDDMNSISKFYYVAKRANYNISISIKNSDYILTMKKNQNTLHCDSRIKDINVYDVSDTNIFVYDIETEYGSFQAGVGDIIVSNTDSVFLRFQYNRQDFTKNRSDTFRLATLCGDNLTEDIFNRKPIELEFEKVFHPFVLLTKKRYIANKYENTKDPFQLKCVDAKGIALTRRDYCPMVKKCYKRVIDTILNDKTSTGEIFDENLDSVKRSTEVYCSFIDKIYNYEIDIDDLVVSAMLASSYKTRPVHVQLAERLKQRKEEVQIGDRIPYIYIESNDPKQQKSELGEDPRYAVQNKLKYNRSCYLEQLAKPLLGFYKIVLKDREDLLDHIIDYTNDILVKCGGKSLKPSDFKIDE